MKKILILMAVAFAATAHAADDVPSDNILKNQPLTGPSIFIGNRILGTGDVDINSRGNVTYLPVLGNNVLHGPQYLPYHPTAATIYPRVVTVKCTERVVHRRAHSNPATTPAVQTFMDCDGYNWSPEQGRAEYLFVQPVVVKAPEPVIKEVLVPGPERIILREVPPKKVKE